MQNLDFWIWLAFAVALFWSIGAAIVKATRQLEERRAAQRHYRARQIELQAHKRALEREGFVPRGALTRDQGRICPHCEGLGFLPHRAVEELETRRILGDV